MRAADFPGPHIVITKQGGFYAVENLRADGQWVVADSVGIETSFFLDHVQQILAVEKTGQLTDVAQANEVAAGILRLEQLVKEYGAAQPHAVKKLEIVIFGAASLALTVLPNSTTGDIDVIAGTDFIGFLDKRQKATNLDLDILPPSFMFYMGNWRERASRLLGYQGREFLLLHPLDTVMQKLLRLDAQKFETKDWPDISEIMRFFDPSEKSMVTLLTENPARFRMADDAEEAAMRRNTGKFLRAFLPVWTVDRLREEGQARRQLARQRAGFEPLPNISLTDHIKLKDVKPPEMDI